MFSLTFCNLTTEERPQDLPDVLIRTTADFELRVDGELIYGEPDFPVVELAGALTAWARRPAASRPDFEFDSMSTPEPGWVWLRRERGGWRVGSINQLRSSLEVWSESEVESAIRAFTVHLVECARTGLGIDVGKWIPGLAE